jgi:hypothetical protein
MAFSTDLVHWTPVRTGAFFLFLELFTLLSFISGTFRFVSLAPQGPGPAATAMMHYADGSTRKFAKRERPALLLDEKGFPLVLYNGVQVRRVLSTVLSTVRLSSLASINLSRVCPVLISAPRFISHTDYGNGTSLTHDHLHVCSRAGTGRPLPLRWALECLCRAVPQRR